MVVFFTQIIYCFSFNIKSFLSYRLHFVMNIILHLLCKLLSNTCEIKYLLLIYNIIYNSFCQLFGCYLCNRTGSFRSSINLCSVILTFYRMFYFLDNIFYAHIISSSTFRMNKNTPKNSFFL